MVLLSFGAWIPCRPQTFVSEREQRGNAKLIACFESLNTWKIIAEWVIDMSIQKAFSTVLLLFVYLCAYQTRLLFHVDAFESFVFSMAHSKIKATYRLKTFDDCFERLYEAESISISFVAANFPRCLINRPLFDRVVKIWWIVIGSWCANNINNLCKSIERENQLSQNGF